MGKAWTISLIIHVALLAAVIAIFAVIVYGEREAVGRFTRHRSGRLAGVVVFARAWWRGEIGGLGVMWSRTLIAGVFIFLCALGLWVNQYRSLPPDPDTVKLKDNTEVKGEIVKQEFGKYVVLQKSDSTKQVIVWDQVQGVTLSNPPWYLRVSDMTETLLKFGVLGGVIVFAIGLWQYRVSQKWERAKFLQEKISNFEANETATNARTMLMFNGRNVYLYGGDYDPVNVTNETLASALRRPSAGAGFTEDEQAIRDTFNVYLSYLDEFNVFLEMGLMKERELKLYLKDWFKIIGDTRDATLSDGARRQLWDYMRQHGYDNAVKLINRYGYNVEPLP